MNNINNFAGMQGVDTSAGNKTSRIGASFGTFAPQKISYEKYLLNSLDGLATINMPYFQMHNIERVSDCDGVIRDFKQGALDDSWLLSGLKSLSYTTEGSRLIKQAIKKNDDNSVTITFKGVGKSYKITQKDFDDAMKKYIFHKETNPDGSVSASKEKLYSKGDSDVLAFELAMEKLRQDILEGNIDKTVPHYALTAFNSPDRLLDNGLSSQVYYLLSGNEACTVSNSDVTDSDRTESNLKNNKDMLNPFLDNYRKMPNRYAVTFNVKDNLRIRDLYGNTVKFKPNISYSLKTADSKTVVLTSPYDSSRPIRIPLEMFNEIVNVLNYQDVVDSNSEFDIPLKEYSSKYASACNYVNNHY